MAARFENDLDWFAYCYVSGELSADETQRFEEMLADCQEAREAVARAVELIEAVRANSHVELGHAARLIPSSRTAAGRGSWLLAGLSLATAASMAIVFAYQSHRQAEQIADRTEPPHVQSASPSAGQLTVAWLESRTELPDDEEGLTVLAEHIDLEDSTPAERDDAEPVAPSWLTAAVTGVPSPDSESAIDE